MEKDIVLAGGARTAIGSFGGSLADVPATELGAAVIRESLRRAGVDATRVDEVYMGCVLQAGLGQNVARQAAMGAGIPIETPALTVNNVCGSALKCVNMAAAAIRAGDAGIIAAGGVENMSRAPYALNNARFGYRMNNGELVDLMIEDALKDAFNGYHMGITAENLAEKYGISREEQDEFAAASQRKCEQAWENGAFDDEIVAVEVKRKKETISFSRDEYPRSGVTAESLRRLRPAFKPDGTVTAANASGINDGAASIFVMDGGTARNLGVMPQARIVAYASAGVEPGIMGIGPAESTRLALKKAGLGMDDIDLIEANEAFAAQALAVAKELELDMSKVNVNGGAIALGHPVGASGCRILVSLLYEMERRGAKYGLATLCVGGGMGVSTIVENLR